MSSGDLLYGTPKFGLLPLKCHSDAHTALSMVVIWMHKPIGMWHFHLLNDWLKLCVVSLAMVSWWLCANIVNVRTFLSPTIGNFVPFSKPYFSIPQILFIRNYKTAGRLRLRCRDCFFERRDNRLYVECKTYARHRQAQIMSEPRTPWRFRRKIWKHVKWDWLFYRLHIALIFSRSRFPCRSMYPCKPLQIVFTDFCASWSLCCPRFFGVMGSKIGHHYMLSC